VIVVLSVALAAVFLLTGALKVRGVEVMRERAAQVGMTIASYRRIGWCEIAGAAGLLAGLAVPALAVAALVALILLLVGAVVVHLRSGDRPVEAAPAAVCGLAAVALLVLVLTPPQ